MNKFSKSSDEVTLEPLADEEAADKVLSAMHGDDPLVFVARTKDGYPHVVDLTRYRDGSADLGLIGVPDMIADLLPVIRQEIGDGTRSRNAVVQLLTKSLPAFFRWLAWISVEIGPERAPKNVADLTLWKLLNHTAPASDLFAGVRLRDLYAAIAPTGQRSSRSCRRRISSISRAATLPGATIPRPGSTPFSRSA